MSLTSLLLTTQQMNSPLRLTNKSKAFIYNFLATKCKQRVLRV